jgi:SynChlorMet cassette protein ScmD
MNPSDRLLVNPVVVLREEFDDWAVLFNPDTADAVGINPVGVAIWKLMEEKRPLAEIVSEIRNRFEGVPGTAVGEIAAFIGKLSESGFVGYELKPSGGKSSGR